MAGKAKDVSALIEEALALEVEDAKEAGRLGFMARALVQATMPHSDPGTNEFVRTNGYYQLTMLAPSKIGLPYGSYPRLLMAWLTTEAVRTKSNELILGNSLSEFMRGLGLLPTGGRWGTVSRVKDQMVRLFSTSISCVYDEGPRTSLANVTTVSKADLWWDPQQPDQAGLWESKVLLTTEFFNEITESPVPLDLGVLKALSKSPMAIDIYVWASYRRSYAKRLTEIPWEGLQMQFGAGYGSDSRGRADFKRNFLKAANKVAMYDANLGLAEGEHGLILVPKRTHIRKLG
jgi:hypothetical protein